eukprot:2573532-Heterocapsa_arctica.AAC.1
MGHRARISRLSPISALLVLLAKRSVNVHIFPLIIYRLQQMIPSAVIVAIGENAGSMKPSMKKYAREVLNWHPNQFQVRNSSNFSLTQRRKL